MSWSKIALSGVAAGVVGNVYDFLIHGFLMADTYRGLPEVFSQEQGNPLYFLLTSLCLWTVAAALFCKTRSAWSAGFKGGATFGFWVGILGFFPNFYHALVIAEFPYYLSWCWGTIGLIGGLIGGAVLGLIQKNA